MPKTLNEEDKRIFIFSADQKASGSGRIESPYLENNRTFQQNILQNEPEHQKFFLQSLKKRT